MWAAPAASYGVITAILHNSIVPITITASHNRIYQHTSTLHIPLMSRGTPPASRSC